MTVWVKINFDETELRQQVKAAGARWIPEYKAWKMEYETARKFELKKRIIKREVK